MTPRDKKLKKWAIWALTATLAVGFSGCQKLSDLRAFILGKIDEAQTKVEEVKTQINDTKNSIETKVNEIKDAAKQIEAAGTQVKEAVGAVKKVTE